MFYYRYRSGSELSIKELIYDELYFGSRAECNDPYEGKIFAVLDKDETFWNNLVHVALKFFNNDTVEYLLKRIIEFYISKAPMYIDELLKISKDEFLQLGNDEFETTILKNMYDTLNKYISLYLPVEQYFACFSRNMNNYLMWSHYANNHTGFCLVFKPINQEIQQNPFWKKTHVGIKIPQGKIPYINLTVDDSFTIQDVKYVAEPTCLDGMMCFPGGVVGERYTPQEIEEFQRQYSQTYLQKHSVWGYEEESRVVLSTIYPWMTGGAISITPHDRLFRYNPTQLVGIVLGVKMPKSQRDRIKEIITEKVERWYIPTTGHRIISNFILFEETLSETNREVIIEPKEIYTGASVIMKDNPDFARLYDEWQNGYAIEFDDNSAKKIIVK